MASDAHEPTPQALIAEARRARDGGRLAETRSLQARAVECLRGGPDRAALAHALRHLADLDTAAGDPRADEGYKEALALYRALPDPPALDLANAVRAHAAHLEKTGRLAAARALWAETESRYAALGPTFERMLGRPENPGLAEARARLARLEG